MERKVSMHGEGSDVEDGRPVSGGTHRDRSLGGGILSSGEGSVWREGGRDWSGSHGFRGGNLGGNFSSAEDGREEGGAEDLHAGDGVGLSGGSSDPQHHHPRSGNVVVGRFTGGIPVSGQSYVKVDPNPRNPDRPIITIIRQPPAGGGGTSASRSQQHHQHHRQLQQQSPHQHQHPQQHSHYLPQHLQHMQQGGKQGIGAERGGRHGPHGGGKQYGPGQCYRCGGFGHKQFNCPKLPSNRQ